MENEQQKCPIVSIDTLQKSGNGTGVIIAPRPSPFAKGFFFTKEASFFICGHAAIGQTENGFLLPFFDLANNKELLALLKLYYMDGSFDKEYDYNTRGAWFAFYLGSFKIEKSGEISDYLRTNPKVWLCFIDKELLEKCRGLI